MKTVTSDGSFRRHPPKRLTSFMCRRLWIASFGSSMIRRNIWRARGRWFGIWAIRTWVRSRMATTWYWVIAFIWLIRVVCFQKVLSSIDVNGFPVIWYCNEGLLRAPQPCTCLFAKHREALSKSLVSSIDFFSHFKPFKKSSDNIWLITYLYGCNVYGRSKLRILPTGLRHPMRQIVRDDRLNASTSVIDRVSLTNSLKLVV